MNWPMPCLTVMLLMSVVAVCDDTTSKPMPAQKAAATMQLPEGFRATCFASEPDVVEPIAFTIDTRGRLWVVESQAYPNWQKSGPGKDRVVILEDTDGDGVHDKRTVFLDNGRNLTGIELGFGGVWLLSAPEFLFIPVKDGEDKPAGPAKVLLDGWNTDIKHNIVSNLTWGMDGWLYGCHGITLKSKVGKPGTPDQDRKVFDCCIWRYHSTRENFEVVAWGSTNPWGLDYDQFGTWFMTNCVIDHVFQVVPNAHYIRMFGTDPNPYIYHPLPGCADHKHWGGGKWTDGGRFDDNLGGHAHSGLMIYQEGNWPQEYRNSLFTLSIHGKRLQQERIDYKFGVAIARHAPDTLKVKDPWFMGVQAKAGPDGGVYMLDWNDTGECHSYVNTQKTTGRIYKVTYGNPAPWKKDLSKFRDDELVDLHRQSNIEWHIRQARRLLQERHAAGSQLNFDPLRAMVTDQQLPVPNRLRALWTLHACQANPDYARYWQHDNDNQVRAWTLRLACDHLDKPCMLQLNLPVTGQPGQPMSRQVAMTLLSVMPRLSDQQRWEVIKLLGHGMAMQKPKQIADIQHATYEEYILTLFWNGCEPWIKPDPKLPQLLTFMTHPWHIEWATRKLVSLHAIKQLDQWATELKEPSARQAILLGLEKSIEGQSVTYSETWQSLLKKLSSSDDSLKQRTLELAARLGDPASLKSLRARLTDQSSPDDERIRSLAILSLKPSTELLSTMLPLLDQPSLRPHVIKNLARFDNDEVPKALLRWYPQATTPEKQDILAALSSRPRYARALLDALDARTIPGNDVLAPTVVTLRQLSQPDIRKRVMQRWGTAATPAALKERMARLQNLLTPAYLSEADLKQGRALFDRHCAACHKLFGEGQSVGPELTGAQRLNIEYLLENTINPNAIVAQDHRATTFILHSGRVITGLSTRKLGDVLSIQTATELLTINQSEIESQKQTDKSLMPEGLLDPLSHHEIRNLIAYLRSPHQVAK